MEELQLEFVRYVHYFDDSINTESVQELIGILASVPSVDLFISTPGGELPAMKVLLHFINQHPDITIYLTHYVASAGTLLLTDCDKEVYLSEELDLLLFHQIDREFGGRFRKQLFNSEILFEQIKNENQKYADKFKRLGLNSKEIKRFMEGEDIILYKKDFDRLKVNKK